MIGSIIAPGGAGTITLHTQVRVMKPFTTALLALGLAACGAATASIAPEDLGLTARDAFLEARTEARSWSGDARLRYVEGTGITPSGQALEGAGEWRFHYTAPGRAGELLVRVAPLSLIAEERAATSPPGFVIGQNALSSSWVDSPQALSAVLNARGSSAADLAASLVLVPTVPSRWVVRLSDEGSARWVVNAETGAVLEGGS